MHLGGGCSVTPFPLGIRLCKVSSRGVGRKTRPASVAREEERALCRLRAKLHGRPQALSARLEVLMVQKRAAYETRNMQCYEAAIRAMLYYAQTL